MITWLWSLLTLLCFLWCSPQLLILLSLVRDFLLSHTQWWHGCSVLTWLMRRGSRDHLSLCWPSCKSNAFPFILAVGFLCYLDLLSGALPLDSTSNFAFDLIWITSQKGSIYSHFPYLYFYLLLPCIYWKLYTVLGEHSYMRNTEAALSSQMKY